MGGSGDYFDVADTVIAMEDFVPREATDRAKEIARQYATGRSPENNDTFGDISPRIPQPESIDPSRGKRSVKWNVRDVDEMVFGTEDIDLAAVEQLVDLGQLRAIAEAMVYAKQEYIDGKISLIDAIDLVLADIEERGLDAIAPFPQGNLAEFRRFELAAAMNRLRTLKVDLNEQTS